MSVPSQSLAASNALVAPDTDQQETREWMEALAAVIETEGPERKDTIAGIRDPAVMPKAFDLATRIDRLSEQGTQAMIFRDAVRPQPAVVLIQ